MKNIAVYNETLSLSDNGLLKIILGQKNHYFSISNHLVVLHPVAGIKEVKNRYLQSFNHFVD